MVKSSMKYQETAAGSSPRETAAGSRPQENDSPNQSKHQSKHVEADRPVQEANASSTSDELVYDCLIRDIDNQPKNPLPWVQLAQVVCKRTKAASWNSARVTLKDGRNLNPKRLLLEAIDADPTFARAYDMLGTVLLLPNEHVQLLDGRSMTKQDLFVEAIRHDPKLAVAYCHLSEIMPRKLTAKVTLYDGRTLDRKELVRAGWSCDQECGLAYAQLGKNENENEFAQLGKTYLHFARVLAESGMSASDIREFAVPIVKQCPPTFAAQTAMKRDFYLNAIHHAPRNALAYVMLGRCNYEPGQTVKLLDGRTMTPTGMFAEAVDCNPLCWKAHLALAKGKRIHQSERKQIYAKIINTNPHCTKAMVNLASLLRPKETVAIGGIAMDRRSLLAHAIDSASPTGRDRALAQVALAMQPGETVLVAEKEQTATDLLRIAQPSKHPAVVLAMCTVFPSESFVLPYQNIQLTYRKRDMLLACLREKPWTATAYLLLGKSLKEKEAIQLPAANGRPAETLNARQLYSRAIEYDQTLVDAWCSLSITLKPNEEWEQPLGLGESTKVTAVACLTRCVEMEPCNPQPKYLLAMLLGFSHMEKDWYREDLYKLKQGTAYYDHKTSTFSTLNAGYQVSIDGSYVPKVCLSSRSLDLRELLEWSFQDDPPPVRAYVLASTLSSFPRFRDFETPTSSAEVEFLVKAMSADPTCFDAFWLASKLIGDKAVVSVEAKGRLTKKDLLLQCIKLRPEFHKALYRLILTMHNTNTNEVVTEDGTKRTRLDLIKELIQRNPSSAPAFYYLGLCLKTIAAPIVLEPSGTTSWTAKQAFVEAIRLDPSMADAYVELAQTLSSDEGIILKDGRLMSGSLLCNEAIRLNPKNPEYYYALANSLDPNASMNMANGETWNVEKILKHAIARGSTKARGKLATLLRQKGKSSCTDPYMTTRDMFMDSTHDGKNPNFESYYGLAVYEREQEWCVKTIKTFPQMEPRAASAVWFALGIRMDEGLSWTFRYNNRELEKTDVFIRAVELDPTNLQYIKALAIRIPKDRSIKLYNGNHVTRDDLLSDRALSLCAPKPSLDEESTCCCIS